MSEGHVDIRQNITPPYDMIKKFINSLSNESVGYTYLYCWTVLMDRGLGITSIVEEGEVGKEK